MFIMRCNLKIFLVFSSWGFFIQQSRMENILVKLFKLDKWFRMRCNLKIFLIYSSDGPFVCMSGTICGNLEEGIMSNISVKLS